jgi:hypothetical protein
MSDPPPLVPTLPESFDGFRLELVDKINQKSPARRCNRSLHESTLLCFNPLLF